MEKDLIYPKWVIYLYSCGYTLHPDLLREIYIKAKDDIHSN